MNFGMFEAAVGAIDCALFLVNYEMKIIYANNGASRIFKYSIDELVGMPVNNLVPVDARDKHLGKMVKYRDASIPRPLGMGRELMGLTKDGIEVLLEIALTPFEYEGDRYTMCVCVDLSVKQEEAELLASQIKASLSAI